MALPFGAYEGQDLTSYEEGNKFLPREFYSLNYTPSQTLASTIGSTGGITGTQAAYPYKWPPEGGGNAGDINYGNKYNLDMDTAKTITSGVWSTDMSAPGTKMTASYKPVDQKIAKDKHGNWKYVDSNKNVYHANINAKPMFASLLEKATGLDLKGKHGLSEEFTARKLGSTMGKEWDEEEMNIGTRRTVPQHLLQRWMENRDIRIAQEKAAADKVAASKVAAEASGANVGHYTPGASHMTRGRDQGGLGLTQSQAQDVSAANEAAGYGGWGLAEGGRIGYRNGEFVEDINVEGPGFDVNEQTAGFIDPQDALNDMSLDIFGKPLNLLNEDEYQILIDLANDQAMGEQDQGIASLV